MSEEIRARHVRLSLPVEHVEPREPRPSPAGRRAHRSLLCARHARRRAHVRDQRGQDERAAPESIPSGVFEDASALVISAYLMRCKPGDPMPEATLRAIELAREARRARRADARHPVRRSPSARSSGARSSAEHVDILAMNEEEGEALDRSRRSAARVRARARPRPTSCCARPARPGSTSRATPTTR